MTQYPKGSEWRKWDLHIHTPQTAKNDLFGTTEDIWEQYMLKLEAHDDIAVLGITDYFSIDNYIYLKQQQCSGRLQNKTLIPNVELRILPVTHKDTPINIHVLFDPALEKTTIEREFFRCLNFSYQGNNYSCIKDDLITLGRAYKSDSTLDSTLAWREGIGQFNVAFNELQQVLKKESISSSVIVAVSNSSNDGNSGIKHSALAAVRQEIYRMSDIIFSSNNNDVKYFLGQSIDNQKTIIDKYGSIKPCIIGSDAHSLDKVNIFPNERVTWIKADPTFEGLKQIIIEPEERVRIQKENPSVEKDKSPFTKITIPEQTQVFAEDHDIVFDATKLPLNNNLISIIGGRGTGKSVLVNYLAAAFRKSNNINDYNLNSKIVISRKTSLLELEKEFKVSENPNVPFMYIAQSQIKRLVQNKDIFTQNIRETIGVADKYNISSEYTANAESAINEYFRIIKIINSNDTSSVEKKHAIDKEIKRYNDFIANITSEQNKKKLEEYKNKIKELNNINNHIEKINSFIKRLDDFYTLTNTEIADINKQFTCWKINIPNIDFTVTKQYITESFLPLLKKRYDDTNTDIDKTKNAFKDYTGDLSSLLSNVSAYQTKVSELKVKLENIYKEETKYKELTSESFKALGYRIKQSIDEYSTLIENKWKEFTGNSGEMEQHKKEILNVILQENLNVSVSVNFNTQRMNELLLSKLDGRSYSERKLCNILKIDSLEDYYNFICQSTTKNVFNTDIQDDLRGQILELFFKHYTSFISHEINVTLNGKPITKLSYGQQGTVYLRLQIAANLFSETIIYDQPEDDLDNSFITTELVDIFKKIKKYRQIIIVSHNANLVVNADSEQVIIAHNNGGVLSYTSGSLEDPTINAEVCRILEGGKTAFEKREKKYNLRTL